MAELATLRQLLLVGQHLERTIEPSRRLQAPDEACLTIEQLLRPGRGDRDRLSLEDVVAQDQVRDLVGHLG
jgi:hypothetical protein